MNNWVKFWLFLISLNLTGFVGTEAIMLANTIKTNHPESSKRSNCKTIFKLFCTPISQGAPRGRRSAGSRSDCPQITALVPELGKNRVLGLTAKERPTFWFALDFPSETRLASDLQLQFVMVDPETEADIVDINLPLPKQAGIITVTLSETNPALEVGARYGWRLQCIATSGNKKSAYGWVERVDLNPNVEQELAIATSEGEKVTIYGKNGLWYETVTSLGLMYQENPQDEIIKADWLSLLTDIELEELAEQPILP